MDLINMTKKELFTCIINYINIINPMDIVSKSINLHSDIRLYLNGLDYRLGIHTNTNTDRFFIYRKKIIYRYHDLNGINFIDSKIRTNIMSEEEFFQESLITVMNDLDFESYLIIKEIIQILHDFLRD